MNMTDKTLSRSRYLAPLLLIGLLLVVGCANQAPSPRTTPSLSEEQIRLNLESFDQVWETIRDKHWQTEPGGQDWQAIGEEMRPRAAAATTMAECRGVIGEMLGTLGQSHFSVFPAQVYEDAAGEDDPSATPKGERDGSPGIAARIVADHALVTRVDPGSAAETAGVGTGWEIISISDRLVAPMLERLNREMEGESSLGLIMSRAVEARLSGGIGDTQTVRFLNAADDSVEIDFILGEKRGHKSSFGNLPPSYVWHQTRTLDGGIGYFAFNYFLDLVRVMPAYNQAMDSFREAPGIIIDLRGNPGGLGAMAMGMAGWFIPEKGHLLGTMSMRTGDLKFAINPRMDGYGGPVAILIDEGSASTSEIMAGGLKDLDRARIFGARSAGAALPSYIDKLPNGDGFQYAVANYVSWSGDVLEGVGVLPHQEIALTREALLQGRDPALQAAIEWINTTR